MSKKKIITLIVSIILSLGVLGGSVAGIVVAVNKNKEEGEDTPPNNGVIIEEKSSIEVLDMILGAIKNEWAGSSSTDTPILSYDLSSNITYNDDAYRVVVKGNITDDILKDKFLIQILDSAQTVVIGFYITNDKFYLDLGEGKQKMYLEDITADFILSKLADVTGDLGSTIDELLAGIDMNLNDIMQVVYTFLLGDNEVIVEDNVRKVRLEANVSGFITTLFGLVGLIDINGMLEGILGEPPGIDLVEFLNSIEVPYIQSVITCEIADEKASHVDINTVVGDSNFNFDLNLATYAENTDIGIPTEIENYLPFSLTNFEFNTAINVSADNLDIGNIVNLIAGKKVLDDGIAVIKSDIGFSIRLVSDLDLKDNNKNRILIEIYKGNISSEVLCGIYYINGVLYVNTDTVLAGTVNVPNFKLEGLNITGYLGQLVDLITNAIGGNATDSNEPAPAFAVVNANFADGEVVKQPAFVSIINFLATFVNMSDFITASSENVSLKVNKAFIEKILTIAKSDASLDEVFAYIGDDAEITIGINISGNSITNLYLDLALPKYEVDANVVVDGIKIGFANEEVESNINAALNNKEYVLIMDLSQGTNAISKEFIDAIASMIAKLDLQLDMSLSIKQGEYDLSEILALLGIQDSLVINNPQDILLNVSLVIKTNISITDSNETQIVIELIDNNNNVLVGAYYSSKAIYVNISGLLNALNISNVVVPGFKYEGIDITALIVGWLETLYPGSESGGDEGDTDGGDNEGDSSFDFYKIIEGLIINEEGISLSIFDDTLAYILTSLGVDFTLPSIGSITVGYDKEAYISIGKEDYIFFEGRLTTLRIGYIPSINMPSFETGYYDKLSDLVLAVVGNIDVEASLFIEAEQFDIGKVINTLAGETLIAEGNAVLEGGLYYDVLLKGQLGKDDATTKIAFELYKNGIAGTKLLGIYLIDGVVYINISDLLAPTVKLPNLKISGVSLSGLYVDLLQQLDDLLKPAESTLNFATSDSTASFIDTIIELLANNFDIQDLLTSQDGIIKLRLDKLLDTAVGSVTLPEMSIAIDIFNTKLALELDGLQVGLDITRYSLGKPVTINPILTDDYIEVVENNTVSEAAISAIISVLSKINLSANTQLSIAQGDYDLSSLLALAGLDKELIINNPNDLVMDATIRIQANLDLENNNNTKLLLEILDTNNTVLIGAYYNEGVLYVDISGLIAAMKIKEINPNNFKFAYDGINITNLINGLIADLINQNTPNLAQSIDANAEDAFDIKDILKGLVLNNQGITLNVTDAMLKGILSLIGLDADLQLGDFIIGVGFENKDIVIGSETGIQFTATLDTLTIGYDFDIQMPQFDGFNTSLSDLILSIIGNISVSAEGQLLANDLDVGKLVNTIAGETLFQEGNAVLKANATFGIKLDAKLGRTDADTSIALEIYNNNLQGNILLGVYYVNGVIYINLDNILSEYIKLPNIMIEGYSLSGLYKDLLDRLDALMTPADAVAELSQAESEEEFVEETISKIDISDIINLITFENGIIGIRLDSVLENVLNDVTLPEITVELNIDESSIAILLEGFVGKLVLDNALIGYPVEVNADISGEYISLLENGSISDDAINAIISSLAKIDIGIKAQLSIAQGDYDLSSLLALAGLNRELIINNPSDIVLDANIRVQAKLDLENSENTSILLEITDIDNNVLVGAYYSQNVLYVDISGLIAAMKIKEINPNNFKFAYDGINITDLINGLIADLVNQEQGTPSVETLTDTNTDTDGKFDIKDLLKALIISEKGVTLNVTDAILKGLLSLVGLDVDLQLGDFIIGVGFENKDIVIGSETGIQFTATLEKLTVGYDFDIVMPEFDNYSTSLSDLLLSIIGNISVSVDGQMLANDLDIGKLVNTIVGETLITEGNAVLSASTYFGIKFDIKLGRTDEDTTIVVELFENNLQGKLLVGVYYVNGTIYINLDQLLSDYVNLPNIKIEGYSLSSLYTDLLDRLDALMTPAEAVAALAQADSEAEFVEETMNNVDINDIFDLISVQDGVISFRLDMLLSNFVNNITLPEITVEVNIDASTLAVQLEGFELKLTLENALIGYPIEVEPNIDNDYVNLLENGNITEEFIDAIFAMALKMNINANLELSLKQGSYDLSSLINDIGLIAGEDLGLEGVVFNVPEDKTYTLNANIVIDIDIYDNANSQFIIDLSLEGKQFVKIFYTQGMLFIDLSALNDNNIITDIKAPKIKIMGINLTNLISGLLDSLKSEAGITPNLASESSLAISDAVKDIIDSIILNKDNGIELAITHAMLQALITELGGTFDMPDIGDIVINGSIKPVTISVSLPKYGIALALSINSFNMGYDGDFSSIENVNPDEYSGSVSDLILDLLSGVEISMDVDLMFEAGTYNVSNLLALFGLDLSPINVEFLDNTLVPISINAAMSIDKLNPKNSKIMIEIHAKEDFLYGKQGRLIGIYLIDGVVYADLSGIQLAKIALPKLSVELDLGQMLVDAIKSISADFIVSGNTPNLASEENTNVQTLNDLSIFGIDIEFNDDTLIIKALGTAIGDLLKRFNVQVDLPPIDVTIAYDKINGASINVQTGNTITLDVYDIGAKVGYPVDLSYLYNMDLSAYTSDLAEVIARLVGSIALDGRIEINTVKNSINISALLNQMLGNLGVSIPLPINLETQSAITYVGINFAWNLDIDDPAKSEILLELINESNRVIIGIYMKDSNLYIDLNALALPRLKLINFDIGSIIANAIYGLINDLDLDLNTLLGSLINPDENIDQAIENAPNLAGESETIDLIDLILGSIKLTDTVLSAELTAGILNALLSQLGIELDANISISADIMGAEIEATATLDTMSLGIILAIGSIGEYNPIDFSSLNALESTFINLSTESGSKMFESLMRQFHFDYYLELTNVGVDGRKDSILWIRTIEEEDFGANDSAYNYDGISARAGDIMISLFDLADGTANGNSLINIHIDLTTPKYDSEGNLIGYGGGLRIKGTRKLLNVIGLVTGEVVDISVDVDISELLGGLFDGLIQLVNAECTDPNCTIEDCRCTSHNSDCNRINCDCECGHTKCTSSNCTIDPCVCTDHTANCQIPNCTCECGHSQTITDDCVCICANDNCYDCECDCHKPPVVVEGCQDPNCLCEGCLGCDDIGCECDCHAIPEPSVEILKAINLLMSGTDNLTAQIVINGDGLRTFLVETLNNLFRTLDLGGIGSPQNVVYDDQNANVFARSLYDNIVYPFVQNEIGALAGVVGIINLDETVKSLVNRFLPLPDFTGDGYISLNIVEGTIANLNVNLYGNNNRYLSAKMYEGSNPAVVNWGQVSTNIILDEYSANIYEWLPDNMPVVVQNGTSFTNGTITWTGRDQEGITNLIPGTYTIIGSSSVTSQTISVTVTVRESVEIDHFEPITINPYDTLPTMVKAYMTDGTERLLLDVVITAPPTSFNAHTVIGDITFASGLTKKIFVNYLEVAVSDIISITLDGYDVGKWGLDALLPTSVIVTFADGTVAEMPINEGTLNVGSYTHSIAGTADLEGGVIHATAQIGNGSLVQTIDIEIKVTDKRAIGAYNNESIMYVDPYNYYANGDSIFTRNVPIMFADGLQTVTVLWSFPDGKVFNGYNGSTFNAKLLFGYTADGRWLTDMLQEIDVTVVVQESVISDYSFYEHSDGYYKTNENNIIINPYNPVYPDRVRVVYQDGRVGSLAIKVWDKSNVSLDIQGGNYEARFTVGSDEYEQIITVPITVEAVPSIDMIARYTYSLSNSIDPYEYTLPNVINVDFTDGSTWAVAVNEYINESEITYNGGEITLVANTVIGNLYLEVDVLVKAIVELEIDNEIIFVNGGQLDIEKIPSELKAVFADGSKRVFNIDPARLSNIDLLNPNMPIASFTMVYPDAIAGQENNENAILTFNTHVVMANAPIQTMRRFFDSDSTDYNYTTPIDAEGNPIRVAYTMADGTVVMTDNTYETITWPSAMPIGAADDNGVPYTFNIPGTVNTEFTGTVYGYKVHFASTATGRSQTYATMEFTNLTNDAATVYTIGDSYSSFISSLPRVASNTRRTDYNFVSNYEPVGTRNIAIYWDTSTVNFAVPGTYEMTGYWKAAVGSGGTITSNASTESPYTASTTISVIVAEVDMTDSITLEDQVFNYSEGATYQPVFDTELYESRGYYIDSNGNEMTAPTQPGIYTYKVEITQSGVRGSKTATITISDPDRQVADIMVVQGDAINVLERGLPDSISVRMANSNEYVQVAVVEWLYEWTATDNVGGLRTMRAVTESSSLLGILDVDVYITDLIFVNEYIQDDSMNTYDRGVDTTTRLYAENGMSFDVMVHLSDWQYINELHYLGGIYDMNVDITLENVTWSTTYSVMLGTKIIDEVTSNILFAEGGQLDESKLPTNITVRFEDGTSTIIDVALDQYASELSFLNSSTPVNDYQIPINNIGGQPIAKDITLKVVFTDRMTQTSFRLGYRDETTVYQQDITYTDVNGVMTTITGAITNVSNTADNGSVASSTFGRNSGLNTISGTATNNAISYTIDGFVNTSFSATTYGHKTQIVVSGVLGFTSSAWDSLRYGSFNGNEQVTISKGASIESIMSSLPRIYSVGSNTVNGGSGRSDMNVYWDLSNLNPYIAGEYQVLARWYVDTQDGNNTHELVSQAITITVTDTSELSFASDKTEVRAFSVGSENAQVSFASVENADYIVDDIQILDFNQTKEIVVEWLNNQDLYKVYYNGSTQLPTKAGIYTVKIIPIYPYEGNTTTISLHLVDYAKDFEIIEEYLRLINNVLHDGYVSINEIAAINYARYTLYNVVMASVEKYNQDNSTDLYGILDILDLLLIDLENIVVDSEFDYTGAQNNITVNGVVNDYEVIYSQEDRINAGSYDYSVVISYNGYNAIFSGTMLVAKVSAESLISFENTKQYSEDVEEYPIELTVTNGYVFDEVVITYNGSLVVPTTAGVYTVVITINDTNYEYETTFDYTVLQLDVSSSITVDNVIDGRLNIDYSGNAYELFAKFGKYESFITPDDITVTFDGYLTAPTNNGEYLVEVIVDNGSLVGTYTFTLVINAIDLTSDIIIAGSNQFVYGDDIDLGVTINRQTSYPIRYSYLINESIESNTLPINAGSYTVVVVINDENGNYYGQSSEFAYTVLARDITITVQNTVKVYGDNDPSFSIIAIDGTSFAYGDSFDILIDRQVGNMVGEYVLSLDKSYTNENYNITFVDGILSIVKRTLDITWNGSSIVVVDSYSHNSEYSLTVGNIVEGDQVDVTIDFGGQELLEIGTYELTAVMEDTLTSSNYELPDNIQFVVTIIIRDITDSLSVTNLEQQYQLGVDSYMPTLELLGDYQSLSGDLIATYYLNNEEIAEVSLPGTYTVVVTLNHEQLLVQAEYVFVVNKIVVDNISIQGETEKVYDGNPIDLSITINPNVGFSVVYKQRDGVPTNAGVYDAIIIIEDDIYTGSYEFTVTITSVDVSNDIIIEGDTTITFGSESNLSISVPTINEDYSIHYFIDGERIYALPTDAGIYSIVARVFNNDSYNGNYYGETQAFTYTVNKADISSDISVLGDRITTYGADSNIVLELIGNYIGNTPNIVLKMLISGEYIAIDVLPTLVGNYNMLVEIEDSNYTGSITFEYVIEKYTIVIGVKDIEISYGSELPQREYIILEGEMQYNDTSLNVEYPNINIRELNAGSYVLTATVNEDNYNVIVVDGELLIKKMRLNIALDNKTLTYGTAQNYAFTYTIRLGQVAEWDLDNELGALGMTIHREEGNNVGSYRIFAELTESNYDIILVEATFTISPRTIFVSVDDNRKYTYEDDPQWKINLLDGHLVYDDNINDIGISIVREAGELPGLYNTTLLDESANYNVYFIGRNPVLEIIIRSGEILGATNQQVVYNGSLQQYDIGGITLNNDDQILQYELLEYINANTYYIKLWADKTDMYDYCEVIVEFVINKAESQISGLQDQTVNYNGANQSYDDTSKQLNNSEQTILTDDELTYLNADEYLISFYTEESENYLASRIEVTFSIAKQDVEITINDINKVYGDTLYEYSYIISGGTVFANDDLALVFSIINESTDVGTYEITANSTNSNYNVTVVNGTLTISKAEAVISGYAPQSAEYNGVEQTYDIQGISVNNEEQELQYTTLTFINASTYTIRIYVEESTNYNAASVETTFTITAKEVTITIDNAQKTYGEENPNFTYQITAGEIIAGDELQLEYVVIGDDAIVGICEITANSTNSNYNVTVTNGTLTVIELIE